MVKLSSTCSTSRNARRHLDHQDLRLARIRVGQLRRHQADRVEQLDQVLVAEVARLRLEGGDALAERRRGLVLAGNVLHPGALQRVEARVQVVERDLEPLDVELEADPGPASWRGNRLSIW